MSNIAQDRNTEFWPSCVNLPMPGGYGAAAATIHYAGTMQTLDSSDRPKNPASTTERVVGVVIDQVDNSAGAADAKKVNFRRGPHKFALHGSNPPVAGDVGKMGYASDNRTISKSAADGSLAGEILLIESDGVWINVGYAPLALTAAVTALTDNSAGTANDTIQAMADLTDSPATADALRDDIVTNLLPAIRNNFADVTAKLNEVINALK